MNPESLVSLLEAQDFEAIPLTSDSVLDNIRSLETCSLVIVDSTTPEWVYREADEHHLFSAAYLTVSDDDRHVTAFLDSPEKFNDFIALIRPYVGPLKPVTAELIERIALVKALFPAKRMEVVAQ